jgi:hypothetical protein
VVGAAIVEEATVATGAAVVDWAGLHADRTNARIITIGNKCEASFFSVISLILLKDLICNQDNHKFPFLTGFFRGVKTMLMNE